MPAYTTGCTSLKPGSGSATGRSVSVTVSPTLASCTSLMLAMMKPVSPAASCGSFLACGVKAPTSCTSKSLPLCIMRILVPGLAVPCMTRTRQMTPR